MYFNSLHTTMNDIVMGVNVVILAGHLCVYDADLSRNKVYLCLQILIHPK